jgi:micrococcal nuclease
MPRRFRFPPPPPGLPKRLRVWYLATAAIVSAIVAVLPACPLHDAAGRPVWRVGTVHDGDTVTCVDTEGRPHKIRMQGIDAPEFDQPYGRLSRNALEAKITGRGVRVEGTAHDQHGRLLGTLWIDDRNINREMVADGLAWVFGGFSPDPDLVAAESSARDGRRGLWADPHPVSPSQWRSQHPPHR